MRVWGIVPSCGTYNIEAVKVLSFYVSVSPNITFLFYIELVLSGFHDWTKVFLQSKTSQDLRPPLEQVCSAEFRAGEVNIYFKRSFDESEYEFADFLMKIE